MLALRRLPRICPRLAGVRGNASIETPSTPAAEANTQLPPPPQVASSPAPPAPSPAPRPAKTKPAKASEVAPAAKEDAEEDTGKTPPRVWPTRRPFISLERPREWNRPLAKGVLPAYDFALRYIARDSKILRKELADLKEALKAAESAPEGEKDEEALQKMREKVKILEIQAEVNLPDVRWMARNGMADLNVPVYRHLVEQKWREDGALDLLMERIYQMSVVPDLLPVLQPSLDLRVNFLAPPPKSMYLRARVKRDHKQVEPGIFLLPEQTRKPPTLYTTVFHNDTRLYTLLMVDLDVPDPENESFQSYLHWLHPNIPLSAFSPSPIPLTTTHTRYVPPHPQAGTPYHRYVILLLPQVSATERISIPAIEDADRLGFNFREFAEKYGFDGTRGGGAHMWREVWDKTVSHIYEHTLKIEEPRFGRMPKPDPYAEIKRTKRYL
ncbi:54S ribosomal protein L35, mitochondrial [Grifola frondosa]|uniref:54S ribosomal protein L35, mitochondrial n=1 Tax=Grifola frondosa TaxID=5627 RepID=A0A1C7MTA7_GRIFR|nr:54S ribosomal protein L35, mitochondrial [Grifola frondosa]